jgi:hypothetical protein
MTYHKIVIFPRPKLWRTVLELLFVWFLWQAGLAGEIYDALWRIAPRPADVVVPKTEQPRAAPAF